MSGVKGKTPAVSVIMPVYNAERFLAEAVESILSQSMNDLELIAIDDGSTDRSWDILKAVAAQDSRLRPIRATGKGIGDALNQAVFYAKSNLLARMDADDVSLPGRLTSQFSRMLSDKSVVVLGTQAEIIDSYSCKKSVLRYPVTALSCHAYTRIGVPFAHGSVMMRKEALIEAGGYRPQYDGVEDADLWLRISHHGKMENLDEILFQVRVHDTNSSRRWKEESVLRMLTLRLESASFYDYSDCISLQNMFTMQGPDAVHDLIHFYLFAYISLMNLDRPPLDVKIDEYLKRGRLAEYWGDRELQIFIFLRHLRMLWHNKRYRRILQILMNNSNGRMCVDIFRELYRTIMMGSRRKWEDYPFNLFNLANKASY